MEQGDFPSQSSYNQGDFASQAMNTNTNTILQPLSSQHPQQLPESKGQQLQQQQHLVVAPTVPSHLIGLMANPALAAAAAAMPLFPSTALLSNPGAFLTLPSNINNSNNTNTTQTGISMPSSQTPSMTSASAAHQVGQAQASTTMNNHNPFMHMTLSATAAAALSIQPPTTTSSSQLLPAPPSTLSMMTESSINNSNPTPVKSLNPTGKRPAELTAEERQRQNRDRNREHARCTRMRKKAYTAKLKELVEGLHNERTKEIRQRRIAIQSLAEMQNLRRSVVRSFLNYHAHYEIDERKWTTLIEDKFWLKQPVTPYRSFRSTEIEKAHHISKGLQSILCDAASLSVMIESIGSKSPRWMQRKREEFMRLEEVTRREAAKMSIMPTCLIRQESRLTQNAISSLSSSSGSSNHASSSSGEENGSSGHHRHHHHHGNSNDRFIRPNMLMVHNTKEKYGSSSAVDGAAKVSSSSGSSNDSRGKNNNISSSNNNNNDASNDFHDYHAQPLPDPPAEPAMDSDCNTSSTTNPSGVDDTVDDSPAGDSVRSSDDTETKRVTTDSSSGDDLSASVTATAAVNTGIPPTYKRRKMDGTFGGDAGTLTRPTNHGESTMLSTSSLKKFSPPTIAKKGGIPHNIQPVMSEKGGLSNTDARLSLAPPIPLRPFTGIGMSTSLLSSSSMKQRGSMAVAVADADNSSVSSVASAPQIRAGYYVNEDDMILMDDVLMCPFTFRTHDAVVSGALAECIMPGMLRAHFSERNKLLSLELVYDAMGFMQQLERASGREGAAHIIPSTLEMALAPSVNDAQVLTMAKPPFQIVNVNDVWTRITGYTQMEVEGEPYLSLLEGVGTVTEAFDRPGKPKYNLEDVAKGRAACMTNIHYDKFRKDFIEFVCSYPLTNSNGEVTHLLHVSNDLPSFHGPIMEQ